MKYNIEVEIMNINVEEKYFSFDYRVIIDGKLKKQKHYSDTHSWQLDTDRFNKVLNDGYALQLAIENMF